MRGLMLCIVVLAALAAPPGYAGAPTGLAATPWPMFQGNTRHTGHSPYRGIGEEPYLITKYTLPGGVGEVADGFSVGLDGTIYTTAFGIVFGFDPDDHTIRMMGERFGYLSRSTPAIAANGHIYAGIDDTLALYTPTGALEVIATDLTSNKVFGSSPVIATDGSVYAVHDALWSFTPDLHLRWVRSVGNDFAHNSPAIGLDGTIYTGGSNGQLHAFTPDGDLRWSQLTGAFSNSPVIGDDGTIYVGSNGGWLYAFNPDGTQRWKFTTDEAPYLFGPAIAADPVVGLDGTLYFGTQIPAGDLSAPAVHFYALHPDGTLKWKHRMSRTPGFGGGFSEAVVDADNHVYTCTGERTCLAFSPSGDVLWSYALSPNIVSRTAPFLANNGVLWLLDTSGTLHVLADPALNRLQSTTPAVRAVVCGTQTTATQTVTLTTSGAPVPWTAVERSPASWLTLTESEGQTPATVQLQIDATGLTAGDYATQVRVATAASGMANRAVAIDVLLTVGCRSHLPMVLR